jgi:hypothetical protein
LVVIEREQEQGHLPEMRREAEEIIKNRVLKGK